MPRGTVAVVFDSKGKGRIEERVQARSLLGGRANTHLEKDVSSAGGLEGVGELEEILNLPARAGLISWRV